jgi:Tfp pilus assembly protein PilX
MNHSGSEERRLRAGLRSRGCNRGAVLIVVLLCFAVAATVFVLVARQALMASRVATTELWTAQAQWVAEAAVEKAAARLAADANYAGETWTIPAAGLSGANGAVAKIRVESVADRPNRRLVRVEADYPDAPVHRSRWSMQVTIDRSPSPEKKAESPKDKNAKKP